MSQMRPFAQFQGGCTAGDYLARKKNHLLRKPRAPLLFNTTQLYVNLYTGLDLEGVVCVRQQPSTTIIDPNGTLFGNTPCGLSNYQEFRVPMPNKSSWGQLWLPPRENFATTRDGVAVQKHRQGEKPSPHLRTIPIHLTMSSFSYIVCIYIYYYHKSYAVVRVKQKL